MLSGIKSDTLCYEAIKSIHQWWTGKISGSRCSKQILDTLASVAAGVGGSYGGAVVGAAPTGPLCPVGAVIGMNT